MSKWSGNLELSPLVSGAIIVVVVLIVAFVLWHMTGKPGPNPKVEDAIRAEFAHPETIGKGSQVQGGGNPYSGK